MYIYIHTISNTPSVAMKISQDLLAVYTIDGQGTRWTRLVDELAPAQVMMTI